MKEYELVVFGSTFFAAGVASEYKKSILVIEPKTKPGYEFIDTFHSGSISEYHPETNQGRKFLEYLNDNNLTDDSYILRWTPYLSDVITKSSADYLLMTDILNVAKEDKGYIVTIFNSMGKSEIFAKKIIDTRADFVERKTINFLVKGNPVCKDREELKIIGRYNGLSFVETELSIDDDYPCARKKAVEGYLYLKSIYEDISLIAIADEMYKKSSCEEKEVSMGYIQCFSSFYDNCIEAFDMGAKKGAEIL